PLRLERGDGAGDTILARAEPRRDVGDPERSVGPREPRDHALQRCWRGLGEDRRHAQRDRCTERVPIAPRVLDGDEPLLPGDPKTDRAPVAFEILEPGPR